MSATAANREYLTLRLPTAMLDELRRLAIESERTVGAEIRVAVREYLNTKEGAK